MILEFKSILQIPLEKHQHVKWLGISKVLDWFFFARTYTPHLLVRQHGLNHVCVVVLRTVDVRLTKDSSQRR